MKKSISLLLVLMLVLICGTSVLASDFTDVSNTACEIAVNILASKGIISGYEEDNTYRPNNPISRAEACVIVVRAMGAAKTEIEAAPSGGYTDLDGYGWAEGHINYATSKGVISGYGNGVFRPAGNVTYVEMAAMLINAQGISAEELTGSWPENYYNKAARDGLFANIATGAGWAYGDAATRGNVAIMTYDALDAIETTIQGHTPTADKSDPSSASGDDSHISLPSESGQTGSNGQSDLTPYQRYVKAYEIFENATSMTVKYEGVFDLIAPDGYLVDTSTTDHKIILLTDTSSDIKIFSESTHAFTYFKGNVSNSIDYVTFYQDGYFYAKGRGRKLKMAMPYEAALDQVWFSETLFQLEEEAIKSQYASSNTLTFILNETSTANFLDYPTDIICNVILNSDDSLHSVTFSLYYEESIYGGNTHTIDFVITLTDITTTPIHFTLDENLDDYLEVDEPDGYLIEDWNPNNYL